MEERLVKIWEEAKGRIDPYLKELNIRVFGANNERIDLVMDSFNRLNQQQKTAVLAAGGLVIGLLTVVGLVLYLTGISSLKTELEGSFAAIQELEKDRTDYRRQDARFAKLVEQVGRKSGEVAKKPLFEKIGRDLGVTVEGLNETKVPIPADDPLSKKLQESKVDLRLSNISVPRLLNFLVEVEKANSFLRIRDLQVRGRYGTRLFFDSQITVRGYAAGAGSVE